MNFKIITVNGVDLSNAMHEEATKVFEHAEEPITVVLRRTKGQRIPPVDTSVQDEKYSQDSSQDLPTEHRCFCQHLLETCKHSSDQFSSYIFSQLQLFQMEKSSSTGVHHYQNDDKTHETATYGKSPDEDAFEPLYEEVILDRPPSKDKLGLALLDHKDPVTGLIRVIVNKITRHSIAERCQRLRPGDQILKINGVNIRSMTEASQLLSKNEPSVTFLVSHHWSQQWRIAEDNRQQQKDVFRDVTNCTRLEESTAKSANTNTPPVTAEIPSNNTNFPLKSERSISEERVSNFSQNDQYETRRNDTSNSVQKEQLQFCERLNEPVHREMGLEQTSLHSITEEFTFVRPTENQKESKKSIDLHNNDSCDSAKGSSMDRSTISEPNANENALFKLTETLENLELDALGSHPDFNISCDEDFDSPFQNESSVLSPWVRIAQQDYELLMMKQVNERRDNLTSFSASPTEDVRSGSPNSASFTGDNTSSAYSTGESFRSSSTSSGPRSTTFVDNAHTAMFDGRAPLPQDNFIQCYESGRVEYMSGTAMNLVSSDANSDGEEPACYLTHVTDTDSEGFEDARIEFRTVFTRAALTENNHKHPVPFPRKLHPPNTQLSAITASTADLCTAAADAARSRRTQLSSESNEQLVYERISSPQHLSSTDSNNNESRKASSASTCTVVGNPVGESLLFDDRMGSTHANPVSHDQNNTRFPFERSPFNPDSDTLNSRPPQDTTGLTRSDVCQSESVEDERSRNSAHDCSKEWKVRVRKDGTRYITKKTPSTRDKRLKQREQRLLTERCGATTDDDALTELKLGRHWSREDRKRHMRLAREKKRRREFMQRCRLEVLNENIPADGEIIELSHQKIAKRRNKRMLMDDFVTVQEILAMGDRTVTTKNPLLSVTYI